MKKTELLAEFQALTIREARFRTIAECSPVRLWVTGGTGKSQFFHQKWLTFIGLTGKPTPAVLALKILETER
ncbi:hypothetical protein EDE11_1466 [Methylomonas methanica]|uniref:Uncharacterized protein n=2 Tax=Methylomonas TaxID=416 RepID=A0A140E3B0_9GAMM|nr:hypothetical protein [Methylomonas methanica]AMK74884.1 hypothetical protein JT25_000020 [Methylomonas denitrificans]AMK76641.1 hypothetical protein JT25_009090 [Methylomonas denitrificans]OAH97905.1 hypothetical protein A1342_22785 [Methylomonas methanica]TCV73140.1 hypothetical protein EDE11_1466 [Methylomonas methanica]